MPQNPYKIIKKSVPVPFSLRKMWHNLLTPLSLLRSPWQPVRVFLSRFISFSFISRSFSSSSILSAFLLTSICSCSAATLSFAFSVSSSFSLRFNFNNVSPANKILLKLYASQIKKDLSLTLRKKWSPAPPWSRFGKWCHFGGWSLFFLHNHHWEKFWLHGT